MRNSKQSKSTAIRKLIDSLAEFPGTATLANPYSIEHPDYDLCGGAAIRRRNLEMYLLRFLDEPPSAILVGEAAGYQGCRFSGIAFTSEYTFATHPFFKSGEFHRSGKRERLFREPSGSIVWETITRMPTLPILWNTLPFHPHKPGKILSNRTPARGEQESGFTFLQALREVFDNPPLVGVGNISSKTLDRSGLANKSVRHPAYGGKAEFQRGVLGL